jgi:hypothetical protein
MIRREVAAIDVAGGTALALAVDVWRKEPCNAIRRAIDAEEENTAGDRVEPKADCDRHVTGNEAERREEKRNNGAR